MIDIGKKRVKLRINKNEKEYKINRRRYLAEQLNISNHICFTKRFSRSQAEEVCHSKSLSLNDEL
jgi:hypothetical protein